MVREGLRAMLKLESDLEVAGEARDGREAVAMAMKLRPNVVLMDIAMPGLNGLEASRQLVKALPSTRIIILTAHCDDAYVQSAVGCGVAGSCGRTVMAPPREVRDGGRSGASSRSPSGDQGNDRGLVGRPRSRSSCVSDVQPTDHSLGTRAPHGATRRARSARVGMRMRSVTSSPCRGGV